MKKLVSVLLLVAVVLSFCVTGVSASALSSEEINEKYGALINAVESGDYDAALDELDKLFPVSEDPEPIKEAPGYETIELTTENFFDYFGLVQDDYGYDRDSSGKIKSIYPGGYSIKLKEEYRERYDWSKDEEITLGIKAKAYFHRAKINWETGEVTVSEKADKDVRKAIKKQGEELTLDTQITGWNSFYIYGSSFYHKEKFYGSTYWGGWNAEPGNDYKYYQEVWKVDVVAVSGTLYLTPAE